jgi:hypothetical protein
MGGVPVFSGKIGAGGLISVATATTAYSDKTVLEIETTGSVVEAAIGIAVVVLAIIGLAHAGSDFFGAIAAILLGAALLAQGGAVGAEYSKLLSVITGGTLGAIELGGGMTVEVLAGGSIVVLGILALLGFSPDVLLSAGVIAVGASLILAAGALQRLNTLKVQAAGLSEMAQKVTEGAVACAVTAQVLCGGAGIVLGILALTVMGHANALMLVGLLVLGATAALSGTTLTGRLLRLFNPKSR